ncbi:MAG TPA: HAMP domain-containing protein, partial [Planctomycetes bacterium]|nr:HAMP domain-containing protein [Planctomycetota bacterium]
RTTLSGVPTDLYGNYPPDAGALLLPGEERTWRLPPSPYTPGWDRAWIVLSGMPVKSPAPQVSPKDAVARVRFLPADPKGKPIGWDLLHQNHVFFELSEENERLGALEKGETPAEIAFRWSPVDSPQEQRLSVIVSHRLPRRTRLEKMVFTNRGPYPIHVWGLVLGLRKALMPSEGGASPLRTMPEGDAVGLKEEAAALVRGYHFALYRDGILQPGCTLPGVSVEGARMPRRGRKALETQEVQVGKCRLTPDRTDFEAFVPLKGKGWAGTVLSVIGGDPSLEAYRRILTLAGLLLASLALPFLFVSFLQTLMELRTLRAKLVGSLSLAAALPLLLFSLFLVKVLEEGHKEREVDRLRGELRTVLDHYAKQKASLAEEAKVRFQAVLKSIREKYPPGTPFDPKKTGELAAFLRGELQKLRSSDWGEEAFLRIDLGFLPGLGALDSPLVVYDRPESRRLGEAASPLSGVTFQLRWGVPFLSVRTVPIEAGGGKGGASISLALGIPLDSKILSRVAGRSSVVLYDLAGYPLAWAGGSGEETLGPTELVLEREPARMEEKRRIAEDLMEGRNLPKVFFGGGKAGVFQLVKDSGGMPRALLGVLERAREPSLSLALLGNVGVAPFFGSVGAAILALVFFVGWVVTDRVSRPLERLREGTARISRGELEVRLPAGGNDEVAE